MTASARDRLAESGPTFSVEFLPPKTDEGERLLRQAIRQREPATREVWSALGPGARRATPAPT